MSFIIQARVMRLVSSGVPISWDFLGPSPLSYPAVVGDAQFLTHMQYESMKLSTNMWYLDVFLTVFSLLDLYGRLARALCAF